MRLRNAKSLLAPPLALTVLWKNLLLLAGGSQSLGHKAKNLIKVTHHLCPKTHTRNSALFWGFTDFPKPVQGPSTPGGGPD